MNKGFIHALESIPVFLIWMILLYGIWHHAAFVVDQRESEWRMEKAAHYARTQSDILVHENGKNSWTGCAMFSYEKKRILDYWVEQSCLEKLDQNAPENIAHVGFREENTTISFFDRNMNENEREKMQCAGAQTPVILLPMQTMGVLEVVACE